MSIYRHYKGGFYEFNGYAKHVETGEELAFYYGIESANDGSWARPRADFDAIVTWPDGSEAPRFRKTTDEDKVRVYECWVVCPSCCETLARGRFASKEAGIAAVEEQPYCERCDYELEPDSTPAEEWLCERDYRVEPPYARRAANLCDTNPAT